MGDFSEDILSKQDPGSKDGTVTVTFDDYFAIIQMKCGENRLNVRFVTKLLDALEKVERNRDAKVLITIGDGKYYSNGLDFSWLAFMAQQNPEGGIKFRNTYMAKLNEKIMTFPMPTIAVLNGHAFAAGAILAASHDHIIMNSEKGWWCLNEVHINLRFSDFTTTFMRMKLGAAFHQALVMGHRFTAHEARKHNIAQDICPADELIPRAKRLGKSLVAKQTFDRTSLTNMKRDIYKPAFDAAQRDRDNPLQPGSVFSIKPNL